LLNKNQSIFIGCYQYLYAKIHLQETVHYIKTLLFSQFSVVIRAISKPIYNRNFYYFKIKILIELILEQLYLASKLKRINFFKIEKPEMILAAFEGVATCKYCKQNNIFITTNSFAIIFICHLSKQTNKKGTTVGLYKRKKSVPPNALATIS